jgi:hypothetical protein
MVALLLLGALSTGCRQPAGIEDAAPGASEVAARAAGSARSAVATNFTVDAMTIETRYWNSAAWVVESSGSTTWTQTPPTGAGALTLFQSLSRTVPGYTNTPIELTTLQCSSVTPSVAGTPPDYADGSLAAYSGCIQNPAGAHRDIGVRYRARITATRNTNFGVRFAVDFVGGVLIVDGVVVKQLWNDPFWNGYFDIDNGDFGPDGVTYVPKIETDTSTVLTANFTMQANTTHIIEVVGFENGADYGSSAQFNDGGGWVDAVEKTPPYRVPLTVSIGSGGGRVVSSPAGITCGTTCSANFAWATMPTLTPTADQYFAFGGWSGACSGTAECAPLVETSKSVTATFTRVQWPLNVLFAGAGAGTVASADGALNCTGACVAGLTVGATVSLTATPAANSVFAGWSGGGCSGTGTCTVRMNQAQTVTATFALKTFALSVTKAGTGSGTVTSVPAGIDCGTTCTASYAIGTTVTLAASAATNADFAGWSGACAGTTTCSVPMDQVRAVTATFTKRVSGDTDPPVISCKATPDELWPPNHKMADIKVTVSLKDAGSGIGTFTLVSVTSDEPDDAPETGRWSSRWTRNDDWRSKTERHKKHVGGGRHSDDDDCGYDDDDDNDNGDGSTSNDIQNWTIGTADVAGQLRAERSGKGDGRTYTLTYRGTDQAGNAATTSCTVSVPKSQGRRW